MKRTSWITLIIFIISLLNVPSAHARSFSIDKVHIKAWIQPNGNVLVNETFTYTFDGEYNRVSRSVHLDGHDGINKFEAYELLNQDQEPGFISMDELRPLEMQKKDNTFFSEIHSNNEVKGIFYLYELKNAVSSYDTYSDLTIPFFGTGKNHDVDLHNVTIDIIFPERVRTSNYHAFIHALDGEITGRTEEMVRFQTPVSEKGQLMEVKLLFPPTIMREQVKQTAPVSLKEVLKAEEERALAQEEIRKVQSKTIHFLYTITGIFLLAALGLLFLPQRILRGEGKMADLLTYDPLQLYVIDRAGKRDEFSFFAGILSLIEKGLVTINHTNTLTRFTQDGKAPARTLTFSFHQGDKQMSDCENTFLDWLFTRKVKGGIRIFTMNNIYGATQTEKKEKEYMFGHYLRRFRFMQKEKQWFQHVVEEMKHSGYLHDKVSRITAKVLIMIIMAGLVFAYFIDTASGFGVFMYLIGSVYLLSKSWRAEGRFQLYLVLGLSLLVTIFIIDSHIRLPYMLFILSGALFLTAMPEFILSREASQIRAETRLFRKWLNVKGVVATEQDTQLDRWTGLALILRGGNFTIQSKETKEWRKAAPLSAFIRSNGNPLNYLFETWKYSKPPLSFYKKNEPKSKDGSSSYPGASGGGSASSDSGGGAGAD